MTEYVIHLRPLPSDVPEVVRLRQARKRLLRDYRLRCIEVKEHYRLARERGPFGNQSISKEFNLFPA